MSDLDDFYAYFNVADELSDPMTSLDDLDPAYVRQAKNAYQCQPGLSWPPYLADAENFAAANPEFMAGKAGW